MAPEDHQLVYSTKYIAAHFRPRIAHTFALSVYHQNRISKRENNFIMSFRQLSNIVLLVLWATSGAAVKYVSAFVTPATCGGAAQCVRSTSPRPVTDSGVKQSRLKGASSSALKAAAKGAAKKKKSAKSAKSTEESFKKSDFVSSISEKTGFTKIDSEIALNAVLDTITEQMCLDKKITMVGFGSFQVKERAARKGRNPQTGEEIDIAASKSPTFTASKALKDKVNGKD